ncbi:MAG: SOS response-associated peptidase [Pseudomonadota bacterium]|nr:SOS response-associated peptidase [Pseudomonadota bacterium]MDQ2762324.1 SOS response-associated peptidase [Pseudomonadota bacterium]
MCNDFGNRVPYSAYVEEFSQLRIPLRFHPEAPNLEPRDEIWPTETAPVIRSIERSAELAQFRWGLAPSRPKARVVINMRSEGSTFTRGQCLVPASHYYEFTGAKSPKTRWRFTRIGAAWFCFAGLLGRAQTTDGEVDAFTLLTTAAGPDVAPYHDRQPVVLDRAAWSAWLFETTAADLLRPSPAGTLDVAEAPRGT